MVDDWRRQIAAADVVCVAVPEYAGGMAGALKNASTGWLATGDLYRKPVAILSAGTSGGEHARRQAAQTLTWQGAWVIAELGIAAPLTKFDADGRVTDARDRSGHCHVDGDGARSERLGGAGDRRRRSARHRRGSARPRPLA